MRLVHGSFVLFIEFIISSDNGLSPVRRQAIIWTNAGILLIGPLGTNFGEIWIGIQTFSFDKLHLKTSSVKWRLSCIGLNEFKPVLWHGTAWSQCLCLILQCFSCRHPARSIVAFIGLARSIVWDIRCCYYRVTKVSGPLHRNQVPLIAPSWRR